MPYGNDARQPVDPSTRMVLRDARPIHNISQAIGDEVTGYDLGGYLMAGTRVEPVDVIRSGREVEVWNYHACDPVQRAQFQAAKNRVPAEVGHDPRVPE